MRIAVAVKTQLGLFPNKTSAMFDVEQRFEFCEALSNMVIDGF